MTYIVHSSLIDNIPCGVMQGEIKHQDSAGNKGTLKPGWVQWMTAGSGVVHSEMPSDEFLKSGGQSEGFQLWVNLPAKDKFARPRYQDTPPENIPVVKSQDGKVTIKVIAGESFGTKATIETRSPMMFLDIHVEKGGAFTQEVPEQYNGFAYVWRGEGKLGMEEIAATMGQVALLGNGTTFQITALSNQDIHVLLIAGIPLNEPIARRGPFVMNTWEQIEEAYSDFYKGKLGEIKGADERYAKTKAAVAHQKQTGNWEKK
ncbi:hypothetical protein QZH41_005908 [Actinostola sp. cb2023]|nr:hypothetical protein QZH41_005908 [Actinostola sp. cb2023]